MPLATIASLICLAGILRFSGVERLLRISLRVFLTIADLRIDVEFGSDVVNQVHVDAIVDDDVIRAVLRVYLLPELDPIFETLGWKFRLIAL